jgi:cation diffusion facilitator CzcD-associated flavoprotein CzcO
MGGLHQPAWPDSAGRDVFAGESFHTARWRRDVDLTGKRVAVIGTGASAIQVVPAIVASVARLHLFQRSPPWVLPRPDAAIPRWLQSVLQRASGVRLALRGVIFLWLELMSSALLHPHTAFWARALALRHRRRQIRDPELRERLRPVYPIGCKRVMLSSDFYPALSRHNCRLITQGIGQIEASGIRLLDGSLVEVDVIIYATGFRPLDILNAVEIEGRDGHRLNDDWRERPQAHLGISVHGYPNLHFLLGPNTALGHNSVLTMIESQVQHVLAAIAARRARGARWIEASAEAQAGFIAGLDRRFVGTAWAGGCRSWYLDANGQNIALWIGSVLGYRRRVRSIRNDDYRFG